MNEHNYSKHINLSSKHENFDIQNTRPSFRQPHGIR